MGLKRRFWHTYRIIPIIIGSLLVFTIISALTIFIWSFIAFVIKTEIGLSHIMPSIIWLTSLFLSLVIMTILTKGGTIFPALVLSLIAVSITCFFAKEGLLTISSFMIKLIYSFFASILGFTLTKLYLLFRGSLKVPRKQEKIVHDSVWEDIHLTTKSNTRYIEYK